MLPLASAEASRRLPAVLLLCACLFALSGCATDPFTGGPRWKGGAWSFSATRWLWFQGPREFPVALIATWGIPVALDLVVLPIAGPRDAALELLGGGVGDDYWSDEVAERRAAEVAARAEEGEVEAMAQLATLYAHGLGVELDLALAFRWRREAARGGHVRSMAQLGDAYYRGDGVEADGAQAVRWWRRAARAGDVEATRQVGFAYQRGVGVWRDMPTALAWWRRAAQAGDVEAMVSLGTAYSEGDGVPVDRLEGWRWWSRARERGSLEAGALMEAAGQPEGWLTREFPAKYRDAAEAGDAAACVRLGMCYALGVGTEPDPARALRWFERAAAQRHPAGLHALGQCYALGLGVERDGERAAALFREAAALGSEAARQALRALDD